MLSIERQRSYTCNHCGCTGNSPRGTITTLEELTEKILVFRDKRDWQQYNTLRKLAAAISIEAAEFQNVFLSLDTGDVSAIVETTLTRVVGRHARLPMY